VLSINPRHTSPIQSPTSQSPYFLSFTDTPPPQIYTLSLHDALPISSARARPSSLITCPSGPFTPSTSVSRISLEAPRATASSARSEEHTSELQSQSNLVCRLLLEKKKKKINDQLLFLNVIKS